MKDGFAKQLRHMRELRGLSQVGLAQHAGISVRTLRYWEAAEKLPRRPELESVLEVLSATDEERRNLYAVVPLPRLIRHVKQLPDMEIGADLMPPMNLGDLIRALRHRTGRTQEQFATDMGVTSTTVMRWETLRSLPGDGNLDRICAIVDVTPQEATVLRSRGLMNGAIPDRGDIATLRDQVDSFGLLVSRYSPLTDLFALNLQHYLHLAAPTEPEANYLLAKTLLIYGNMHFMKDNLRAAKGLAQRSVAMFQQSGHYDVMCAQAINLASVFVGGETVQRFESKIEFVRRNLTSRATSDMRLRMYCDLALYYSQAGRIAEAWSVISNAELELGNASDSLENHNYVELSTARILHNLGDSDKAMVKFARIAQTGPENAIYYCYQAEAALAMGEREEAARLVQRAEALAEMYPFEQTRKFVDRVLSRITPDSAY